jgi:serine/threonine protein phosphatase PrpC
MQIATALRAAAETNAGLQRDVNEDRIHLDLARGVFLVIDGVGGHPAGGRAADIALATVRSRFERETGPLVDRMRKAIAMSNNASAGWHCSTGCVATAWMNPAYRAIPMARANSAHMRR